MSGRVVMAVRVAIVRPTASLAGSADIRARVPPARAAARGVSNPATSFGAGLPGTAFAENCVSASLRLRGLGSPTAPKFDNREPSWTRRGSPQTFGQWKCAVGDPRTTEEFVLTGFALAFGESLLFYTIHG
jgi:hypothetical protein